MDLNSCIIPILQHAYNANSLKEALPKMLKNLEAGSPLIAYKTHFDNWVAKVGEANLDSAFYQAFINAPIAALEAYSEHLSDTENVAVPDGPLKIDAFNALLEQPI